MNIYPDCMSVSPFVKRLPYHFHTHSHNKPYRLVSKPSHAQNHRQLISCALVFRQIESLCWPDFLDA